MRDAFKLAVLLELEYPQREFALSDEDLDCQQPGADE
jgi:hypothetical protein